MQNKTQVQTKSGLQKLKESKRGTINAINLIAAIAVPIILTLIKRLMPEFDVNLYAPYVFGAVVVVGGMAISGYSLQDAIVAWRSNDFQQLEVGEAASGVLNVVSDLVDDGVIEG